MANQITASGLETDSLSDIVAQLTEDLQDIYGSDINVASDTPDGQWINIMAQVVIDVLDLITQVYNSFDPDLAIGAVLDQRVTINGIQRLGGTFTLTPVTIVTDRALTLYGLDQEDEPVFTVADNAGNQWQLITTQSPGGAGTYSYSFQAAEPGAILTTPNTITTPVTIVLGVVSINNPSTYSSLGTNEETDAALRLRRQKSVSLASQGYYAGLLAALENINGVTSAYVYENTTSVTDGDGVPGHSIWVIVAGTGAPEDIAQAIYTKRNAGCGMYGSQSYVITRPDGSPFVVLWDDVIAETLFIQFTAVSLDGVNDPDIGLIRSQLPSLYVPGVNGQVNVNRLATLVQQIDPNTLVDSSVVDAGFSTSDIGPFEEVLEPDQKNKQFVITEANIIILPMQVLPANRNIPVSTNLQFQAYGGFGAYTYSIQIDNTGGSIDSSTGEYTAGSTPGIDTIRAEDEQSNFATVNVQVS